MGRRVALLRAVNVGGRNLPMAGLRELCEELGWRDVRTYIQSGNIVFEAPGSGKSLESALERAISGRFSLDVPVVVRTSEQWAKFIAANPFPRTAGEAPNRLQLILSKRTPAKGAAASLEARAAAGERVAAAGGALWLCYPEGIARSRLTPALIDKAVGSPATARNYRTVLKLGEMLEA